MIVTYIHSNYPEDSSQVQLRCRNFADAINRIGWHSANLLDLDAFAQNTAHAQKVCAGSDLLILHRYLCGSAIRSIEYWKARDKKVIVDVDCALDHLTPDIASHSFWFEGGPLCKGVSDIAVRENKSEPVPLEQFKWGLGLVDAAIVSSTRLAMDWSPFTTVYEIPDYLNIDQYPACKQIHETEIWLGLAGNTRISTIISSGLSAALECVCQKHPQVKLAMSGVGNDLGNVLNIPAAQLVTYPRGRFEEWSNLLLKLDIGLLPIHGEYDLRSGRMDLLEFMISKTSWIASNQPSFREFSRYGRLVPNSSKSWEGAILKAIDNIDILRKRAAGEPFLFALSQDVNENIDKVLRLFTDILNQA